MYRTYQVSEASVVRLITSYLMNVLSVYRPDVKCNRVLDVGCGKQPLRAMLEKDGWKYKGLDIEQRGCAVDFLCSLDEPFPVNILDEPFDLVLCIEVLEHISNWKQAFSNLAKSTKAGGLLVITAPFIFQLHEEPHDYWRPTVHAIRKYADSAGFSLVDAKMLGNGWDILETLLYSCIKCPLYLGRCRGGWRMSRPLHAFLKLVLHRVIPFLRRRFDLQLQGYYMTNGFIFTKPASVETTVL